MLTAFTAPVFRIDHQVDQDMTQRYLLAEAIVLVYRHRLSNRPIEPVPFDEDDSAERKAIEPQPTSVWHRLRHWEV